MSNLITFETFNLIAWLDTLLRDENGISEQAYHEMHLLLIDSNPNLSAKLSTVVEATDGRFYIEEDVPFLPTWLK